MAATTRRANVLGDWPTALARSFTPMGSLSLDLAQAAARDTHSLDAAKSPIAM